MNFAKISPFTVGIFPHQDFNETVYCHEFAIRNNNIKRCANISGTLFYDYFIVFSLQVNCLVLTLQSVVSQTNL
jgi:hypothetical protein